MTRFPGLQPLLSSPEFQVVTSTLRPNLFREVLPRPCAAMS